MEILKIVDDNCFSKLLSYVFSHERDEHPELHASKRISEKVFLGFLEKEMKVRFRDLMLASVKGKELFLDSISSISAVITSCSETIRCIIETTKRYKKNVGVETNL